MNRVQADIRARIHYTVAAIVIGLYGIRVCPFVDNLELYQVFLPLIIALLLQYLLRKPLLHRQLHSLAYKHHVSRTFVVELLLFVVTGFLLAIYNKFLYDFPPESGLKVIIGFLGVGYFAALDLSMSYERVLAKHLEQTSSDIDPDDNYFPLVRKFSLFATITVVLFICMFFLLINKDLHWIVEVGDKIPKKTIQLAVLGEFLFVGMVMLAYMLVVIYAYSINLRYFLSNENRVLAEVTRGDLGGSVTVCSNDEFGEMARHTNVMIGTLGQRTQELQRTQDVTILSLASLAETRDNETGAHILRTQRYVQALAHELRDHPRFRHFLNEETIALLFKSAPLHDIGKVGIPDAILLKPDKLDDAEFEIMKTHTTLGKEALVVAEKELGGSSFLSYAREIADTHHEKWDGSGYPNKMAGHDIPISGRLMALADVYDALISKRVYKPAFSHEKALTIIRQGRGTHFDPDVVDAVNRVEESFKGIAVRYGDENTA